MGLWVLILIISANPGTSAATMPAVASEFATKDACENAENFIRQDLEKRGMAKAEKIAGGCVRKY